MADLGTVSPAGTITPRGLRTDEEWRLQGRWWYLYRDGQPADDDDCLNVASGADRPTIVFDYDPS